MNGQDISDTIKLGLCLLIMVFTFGTGYTLFNMFYTPVQNYIYTTQAKMNGADTMTIIDLCSEGDVNGATLYTVMAQYGRELAGVVWEHEDGTQTVYAPGYTNSVDDLLDAIEDNKFNTQYNIFVSEPVPGVDYQAQTMFVGIKEVD